MNDAIYSQESEDGKKHSELLDGTVPHGQSLALVRHSPPRAKKALALTAARKVLCHALDELVSSYAQIANTHGWPTNGTYGRKSGESSPESNHRNDRLQFLESRLLERLERYGSPEYKLVWKYLDTPLGPLILRRVALGRRTSGKDCSGWPTPQTQTPKKEKVNESGSSDFSRKVDVAMGVRDTVNGRKDQQLARRLAGWATPKATDSHGNKRHGTGGQGLHTIAEEAVYGVIIGSTVPTGKRGVLNPDLPRWLMGFEAEWDSYAVTATP